MDFRLSASQEFGRRFADWLQCGFQGCINFKKIVADSLIY